MQRLKDAEVELHTRSAFLQGLLLMSKTDIPVKFSPWFELWNRWHQWLERYEISAVQACLAFPLAFPEIDKVVLGADSLSQLQQIISASHTRPQHELPNLQSENENLINPAHWSNI
jgi:aryl-alcohol dehydrogenase-like predicted oxidoreductase